MHTKFALLAGAAVAAVCSASVALADEITGVVTNAAGDFRIEGVRITIEELGRTTVSGRDGRYRFVDIPAGEYTLTTRAIGRADQSLTISVTGEAVANITLTDEGFTADTIRVVGQRANLFNALNQKRNAESIQDVLAADAIGNFPDENVSESVRRIPGILVENDQGEGRFVTIRGLNPELNSTSINGVRIPAPESDIRGVALDVIDSQTLEGITINKSLTPDMDGDAIGGSIDIKTVTAFDRGEGMNIIGEVGGTYNELTEEFGPRIAGTFTDQYMDGKLGLALSGSYRRREFATENQEVDGAWNVEDGVFWNEEIELRDYIVERERINFSGSLDFRPNENTDLYLRGLFSEFSDDELRRRIEIKLEDANIVSVDPSTDTILFGAGPNADPEEDPFELEIDRDSKDRLETQRIYSVQAGGESRFDLWTLNYQAAFSHAEEEEPSPGNLDVVTFRFNTDAAEDGALGINTSDLINPQIVPQAGGIPYADASAFEIDEWELIQGLAEDDEYSLQFDARRDFTIGQAEAYLKAGVKGRFREKQYDATIEIYEEGDVTLADFEGAPADFPLALFGPTPDAGAIESFFADNRNGAIEIAEGDTLLASTVEDYTAEEDILAGYVMGSYTRGPLTLIGGVRVENTDFSANALQAFDEEVFVPATVEDDYTDVLPSVTVRYELGDDIILRAAAYRALARPVFEGFAPRGEFEGIDGATAEEGAGGNPNLERQIADNFDVGVEWYLGNNGLLSAAVFHKEIDDYIAEIVLTDAQAFGLTIEEFETFTNLDDANVTGIELGYQQALTMLPGPFDGLIVGANATFLDGDAQFGGDGTDASARTIDLPKLSDTLANFVLGYEKGRVDVRLSYAYRSEYLDEINGGFDDGLDRIVDEHGQWDLTGRFRVTDNLQLYGELKNLNDEPFLAFTTVEGRKALLQYEEYGFTANFGLKFTY